MCVCLGEIMYHMYESSHSSQKVAAAPWNWTSVLWLQFSTKTISAIKLPAVSTPHLKYIFLCVRVSSLYIPFKNIYLMCYGCIQYPWRPEEGFPTTVVTHRWFCTTAMHVVARTWDLLEEQPELITTQPPFQCPPSNVVTIKLKYILDLCSVCTGQCHSNLKKRNKKISCL